MLDSSKPMEKAVAPTLKERLDIVRERIARAAQKSGRSLADVLIVAVTKGVPVERILEAREAGITVFGENRVQEAEEKFLQTKELGLEWHMVGHLQTNKIKTALSFFKTVQSVDSVRLAREIHSEAAAIGQIVPVLFEVNISGEPKKFGFKPEEIYGALDEAAGFTNIRIMGLMGISPLVPDEAPKRESFKKLRNIFSVCKTLKKPNIEMRYLSMGMSDDFEIAIEEGSNMVRIGRALFGARHMPKASH